MSNYFVILFFIKKKDKTVQITKVWYEIQHDFLVPNDLNYLAIFADNVVLKGHIGVETANSSKYYS